MARNEEKSHGMLNRWSALKQDLLFGSAKHKHPEKRPNLASECSSLPQAERYRRQILKEIAEKVAVIQNAGLGEHRLRELNDEINKLLRERKHWEKRIMSLGGADYSTSAPRSFDADGQSLHGSEYKYFGATKDLPGVRELFEPDKAEANERKRTRDAIYAHIKSTYYGLGDEEQDLLQVEAELERKLVARAVHEYRMNHPTNSDVAIDSSDSESEESPITANHVNPASDTIGSGISKEELEKRIVERKRKELMAKYAL